MKEHSGVGPWIFYIQYTFPLDDSIYNIKKQSVLTLIKWPIRRPDAERPKIWSVLTVPSLQLIQKF
jgi:hypothetical protein